MTKKRSDWPFRSRRVIQALAFIAFLAFIVKMPALAVASARADWLMRLSPLSGLGASLSSWALLTAFWPAAAVEERLRFHGPLTPAARIPELREHGPRATHIFTLPASIHVPAWTPSLVQ